MRSLTLKLILAFLLVGVISVLLVVVPLRVRTRSEFDRFLSAPDQTVLLSALGDYYAGQAEWTGVGRMLDADPRLARYSRDIALAGGDGVVVFARHTYTIGQSIPRAALDDGLAVQVNGRKAGTVVFVAGAQQPAPPSAGGATRPEDDFLQRVDSAALISAGIAAGMALLVGVLLAGTLARPIRELTAATRAMAAGQLDQRVAVRSRDEIGELAASFNHMSADLARASQARKQMTADLAHDLRTPLSILRGYTEGLRDERLQGTPAIYTLMHEEIAQLQRLVEDLRTLSLADAGELQLNLRAVDPRALLERTGLAYFPLAQQHGVILRVETGDPLPSVMMDTNRMTQVLNNLVSNALRHTPQGEVALSAEAADGRVLLKVRDTGAGISPEDLPYIFDRFYSADKSRQRSGAESTGLGLAIAKAIVEAHGGTIAVESTPGAGATFLIGLPARDASAG